MGDSCDSPEEVRKPLQRRGTCIVISDSENEQPGATSQNPTCRTKPVVIGTSGSEDGKSRQSDGMEHGSEGMEPEGGNERCAGAPVALKQKTPTSTAIYVAPSTVCGGCAPKGQSFGQSILPHSNGRAELVRTDFVSDNAGTESDSSQSDGARSDSQSDSTPKDVGGRLRLVDSVSVSAIPPAALVVEAFRLTMKHVVMADARAVPRGSDATSVSKVLCHLEQGYDMGDVPSTQFVVMIGSDNREDFTTSEVVKLRQLLDKRSVPPLVTTILDTVWENNAVQLFVTWNRAVGNGKIARFVVRHREVDGALVFSWDPIHTTYDLSSINVEVKIVYMASSAKGRTEDVAKDEDALLASRKDLVVKLLRRDKSVWTDAPCVEGGRDTMEKSPDTFHQELGAQFFSQSPCTFHPKLGAEFLEQHTEDNKEKSMHSKEKEGNSVKNKTKRFFFKHLRKTKSNVAFTTVEIYALGDSTRVANGRITKRGRDSLSVKYKGPTKENIELAMSRNPSLKLHLAIFNMLNKVKDSTVFLEPKWYAARNLIRFAVLFKDDVFAMHGVVLDVWIKASGDDGKPIDDLSDDFRKNTKAAFDALKFAPRRNDDGKPVDDLSDEDFNALVEGAAVGGLGGV